MERIKISNQGGNVDEQKDRDGRCASRKNPIQEMGWQLKERGGWQLRSKSKWSKEDLSIPAGREEPQRCEGVLDND